MRSRTRFLALTVASLISVFSASKAHAGLLLEPYVGYDFGKEEASGASNDISSAALGARAGITFSPIFVALDYSLLVAGSLKDSAGTKVDLTGSNLFADVGVQLPLIRAYAGYGFANTLTLSSGGADLKIEDGSGYKLGVGTTLFPLIAINLEYIHTDYKKFGGVAVSDLKANLYMLSVSVPFNF